MNCPWCDTTAGPRALQAHLCERHGDRVGTGTRDGRTFYATTCPQCGARHEQTVRKGTGDPEFLVEFGTEIRMVAFDRLIHHLIAEHDQVADRHAADEQNKVDDRREMER
ncbi:MAG: hypothetical protein ABSA14_03855 [Acidimicrobiales bacterium]